MANYKLSILPLLKTEGGIVDDPDDNGGLTWQGVAYNFYPNWAGWKIVFEIMKRNPKATAKFRAGKPSILNTALYAQKDLALLVELFYKKLYWDFNKLDAFKDQQLAHNVFDCGVNCGVVTAAKMIQRAVNNSYDRLILKDDGKIGAQTLAAVNTSNAVLLYDEFNILRKAYYDAIIKRNPSQVKFKKSWYSRIIPYKS